MTRRSPAGARRQQSSSPPQLPGGYIQRGEQQQQHKAAAHTCSDNGGTHMEGAQHWISPCMTGWSPKLAAMVSVGSEGIKVGRIQTLSWRQLGAQPTTQLTVGCACHSRSMTAPLAAAAVADRHSMLLVIRSIQALCMVAKSSCSWRARHFVPRQRGSGGSRAGSKTRGEHAWMRHVRQMRWQRFTSPTDAKNSSSVMACRRAAFSPCRLAPCANAS